VSLDLLIPFGILIILVIYLIYTRSKFEKDIVQLYEKKFEEWKNTSTVNDKEEVAHKELVGLLYKTKYKLHVELLDEKVKPTLEKGKFTITNLKG